MSAKPRAFSVTKNKPLVGDNVLIDIISDNEHTGNITDILPRKNELIRPAVANIDQAMIVLPHYRRSLILIF